MRSAAAPQTDGRLVMPGAQRETSESIWKYQETSETSGNIRNIRNTWKIGNIRKNQKHQKISGNNTMNDRESRINLGILKDVTAACRVAYPIIAIFEILMIISWFLSSGLEGFYQQETAGYYLIAYISLLAVTSVGLLYIERTDVEKNPKGVIYVVNAVAVFFIIWGIVVSAMDSANDETPVLVYVTSIYVAPFISYLPFAAFIALSVLGFAVTLAAAHMATANFMSLAVNFFVFCVVCVVFSIYYRKLILNKHTQKTELEELSDIRWKYANTDSMTGLLNRRAYNAWLEEAEAAAKAAFAAETTTGNPAGASAEISAGTSAGSLARTSAGFSAGSSAGTSSAGSSAGCSAGISGKSSSVIPAGTSTENPVRTSDEKTAEVLPASGITVCMLDLNGLKQVNDEIGHSAGDELIIAAAKCIELTFNGLGTVYRVGGDEFIVVCENLDNEIIDGAYAALEKRIEAWRGVQVDSIALAKGYASSFDYPEKSISELEQTADSRMYEDKEKYYAAHSKYR